ncbi:hypothetical protein E3N88_38975 [Mikania micrantha]|uniref:Phospholipid scramblase n=1 Tax=Mikania micrantha TaxID=192012 RepID=A0A5N6LVH8_9ASTR|nr:hypothetical protein E3N88_38975 [Mikania micrantha]
MGDRTPLALETIQSQIKQLTEIRSNCHDDANLVASDENYLLREYVLLLELCNVEAENAKLYNEVGTFTEANLEDSIRLQININVLNSSMEFIKSHLHLLLFSKLSKQFDNLTSFIAETVFKGIDKKRPDHQPEYEAMPPLCFLPVIMLQEMEILCLETADVLFIGLNPCGEKEWRQRVYGAAVHNLLETGNYRPPGCLKPAALNSEHLNSAQALELIAERGQKGGDLLKLLENWLRMNWITNLQRLPVFIRFINAGSSPNQTLMKKQQNDGLYTYKILLCKKFGLVKGDIAESLVSGRKLHWRSYRLCGFGANLCSKNSPANLSRKFEHAVHTGPEFSRDFLVQLWVANGKTKTTREKRKKKSVDHAIKHETVLYNKGLHGSSVTRNGHYDHIQGATQSIEYASPEEALIAPLLSRSNLIITRDIEWANLTLGFEQENRYAIVDVSNPQVPAGFIREESNVIARQLLRKRRPFVATITDAYGNELFKVRRPFWWITSSIYAEVGGKEIGVVHRRWHLWKRIYDLYLGNEQFAVVDNWGFWFWTFTLKGINGEVLAEINRDWRGFGFEVFTDAGQYVIRFGSASGMPVELSKKVEEFDVARPLTLLERAVTVALAVSLDNDYFSRHGGWGVPFFVAAE